MANTYLGTNILWGCGSTAGTLTGGVGTLTLCESVETSGDADEELVRDAAGNTYTAAYYDHKRRATLSFVVAGTTTVGTVVGTLSGGITAASMPLAGSLVTLVDAAFSPVAGTWIARNEPTFTRSNTKAMMAKIDLVRFLNNSFPS